MSNSSSEKLIFLQLFSWILLFSGISMHFFSGAVYSQWIVAPIVLIMSLVLRIAIDAYKQRSRSYYRSIDIFYRISIFLALSFFIFILLTDKTLYQKGVMLVLVFFGFVPGYWALNGIKSWLIDDSEE